MRSRRNAVAAAALAAVVGLTGACGNGDGDGDDDPDIVNTQVPDDGNDQEGDGD
ncbi:hypothetical protein ACBI99_11880 [Nonomuraea sp. ATR24]|uniref:hypothetical protein n=1 Tax=unclassified Nonomuraea TaxID=2593643 RepID=UPI0033F4A185